jgi:uncharacterized phage protein (TIGR02220 family)
MRGWIKDYRKELHSNIWMMPPLYHRVWQYLKYKVNHQGATIPTINGKLHIAEGETVTSLRCIAEAVSWNEYGVERVPAAKTIREILNWLQDEGMIMRESNRKGTRIKVVNYSIYQGEYEQGSNTEKTQKKHRGSTNKNVDNVNNEIPYAEIVELLNEAAEKKYKHTTNKTKDLIAARWNEGFRLEDFSAVIKKKSAQWKDDPDMNQYLRPETLFGTKFEGYLNAQGPGVEEDRRIIE